MPLKKRPHAVAKHYKPNSKIQSAHMVASLSSNS